MTLLFDIAPAAGGIGTVVAVVFFLVLLAVAFFAFRILKRTVKFAFRVVIVAIILAIAIAGSIALWAVSASKPATPAERPARSR